MVKITNFVLFLSLFFLVVSCSVPQDISTPIYINTTPIACPNVIPLAEPNPEFLKGVYPSGVVTSEEYNERLSNLIFGGIIAKLSADGIDFSVSDSKEYEYRSSTLSNRVTLFVNGILISNNHLSVTDGLLPNGPFYLGWPVKLDPGYHIVKLVFNIDTGEIIYYEWSFCMIP